jgi:hypothetical protein
MISTIFRHPAATAPLALALAACAATPQQPSAPPVGDTIAAWRLLGTWAPDCRKPAGSGNTHLSFALGPGGTAVIRRNFNDGSSNDVLDIVSATVTSEQLIQVAVMTQGRKDMNVIFLARSADDRIRVMQNVASSGSLIVRNGRLAATGEPTRWQARCG